MLRHAEKTAICSACVHSTPPLCSPLGSLIGSRIQNYKYAYIDFFIRASNEVPVLRHKLTSSSLFGIDSKAKIGHLLFFFFF